MKNSHYTCVLYDHLRPFIEYQTEFYEFFLFLLNFELCTQRWIYSGFLQTLDNWIQGLFKDFQGQQQQFSRIYFKARPPLPSLIAVRSSHKILYCHMILTFYKLITTIIF